MTRLFHVNTILWVTHMCYDSNCNPFEWHTCVMTLIAILPTLFSTPSSFHRLASAEFLIKNKLYKYIQVTFLMTYYLLDLGCIVGLAPTEWCIIWPPSRSQNWPIETNICQQSPTGWAPRSTGTVCQRSLRGATFFEGHQRHLRSCMYSMLSVVSSITFLPASFWYVSDISSWGINCIAGKTIA